MAKLILSSDGIVDTIAIEEEFRKVLNMDSKIAIITSAKENEKKIEAERKSCALFAKLFSPKQIDCFDLENGTADVLFDYDFIYIHGGNPFRLQFFLNKADAKSVFKKLSKTDKTIAGFSAGSMVLGTNMGVCNYLTPEMNEVGLQDFTGLGLTDINICPHYNNFPSMYENCDSKVEQFCKDYKTSITKLYDGEALIIDTKTNKVRKIKDKVIERSL